MKNGILYFLTGLTIGILALVDFMQLGSAEAKGIWATIEWIIFFGSVFYVIAFIVYPFTSRRVLLGKTLGLILVSYALLVGGLYSYVEVGSFTAPDIYENGFNPYGWLMGYFYLFLAAVPFIFIGLVLWNLQNREPEKDT